MMDPDSFEEFHEWFMLTAIMIMIAVMIYHLIQDYCRSPTGDRNRDQDTILSGLEEMAGHRPSVSPSEYWSKEIARAENAKRQHNDNDHRDGFTQENRITYNKYLEIQNSIKNYPRIKRLSEAE